jgi:phospholipid N-methyltransferase
MSQLSLWDESVHPSSSAVARNNAEQAPSTVPKKENRAALRCQSSADAMQKHIDSKHQSANNMLAQPPTRKRLSDADGLRKQAIRLERIQATLRRLAEMHENGSIMPALATFTTRGAIESALFTSPGDSAICVLYNSIIRDERREERVIRLTSEAATMGIPGYFPTPQSLAERLVSMSCIQPGNRILEPSAGTGNLIDAVVKAHQDVSVSYCELNCFLLDILRDKYTTVDCVSFAGRDFVDLDPNRVERFDRVIMNPPFENNEDIDHILHAWCGLLRAGGILTAIVSAGVFTRRDKKAEAFRRFLCDERAHVHDLPAGTFKSSGTGVGAKIVQLRMKH